MSGESTGDTEIAFCPWSGGPLSYLGLTGKSAWLDIAKLTNWEEPNIQMTTFGIGMIWTLEDF